MKKTTVILAIALMGLALRAWDIDLRGLNSDELYTARIAFFDDHVDFASDVHPPAYIIALRAAGSILPGSVEFQARALSVFSGFAFIFLLAYVGFLAGGFRGATAAALFAAFDPGLIALSRLGRGYMFSALILGAAFPLTYLVAAKKQAGKFTALLAVVNALALYTFYYAVFLIAAQLAVAAAVFKRNRPGAKSLLGAAAVSGLAFAAWLPTLLRQTSRIAPGGGWTQWPLTPYEFVRRGIQIFIHHSPFQSCSELVYSLDVKLGALFTALLTALILYAAWSGARKREADLFGFAVSDRAGNMGLGPACVFFVAIYSMAAVAHELRGVFIGFAYFAFLAPPIMAIVVLALKSSRRRFVMPAVVAVVIATQAALLPGVREANREDLREAVRAYDQNAGPSAAALTVAHFIKDAFTVYSKRPGPFYGLPADLPGEGPIPREAPAIMTRNSKKQFKSLMKNRNEVWLILSHEKRNGRDRGQALSVAWLHESGFRVADHGAAKAVRWIVFKKD